MERRKTVLIIGVSSFVGSNLAEHLKKDFRVVGTYFKTRVSIKGVLCLPMDVMKKESIQHMVFAFKPEITIYCAGLTSIKDCFESSKYADALNTAGLINTVYYTEQFNSQIVYLSSQYVFGGAHDVMGEGDTPVPNTVYGHTKSASEFYVQKSCLNYLILRTCNLYGRSWNFNQRTFFEEMEHKFARGESLKCDGKHKMGHLDIYLLALILKGLIDDGVRNRLLHVSTKDVLSYFEFAQLYCEIFGHEPGLAVKSEWYLPREINQLNAEQSAESSQFNLDISNLESGFMLIAPTIEESLMATKQRLGIQGKKVRRGGGGGQAKFI